MFSFAKLCVKREQEIVEVGAKSPSFTLSSTYEKSVTASLDINSTGPRIPTFDDFDVLQNIGRGASANVFLVRHRETGNKYALKRVARGELSSQAQQEQLILRHLAELPGVSKSLSTLEGSWTDEDFLYLLMPWCAGKDLARVLAENQALERERVRTYMAQLVLALKTLHDEQIIHRDLKPQNIFITAEGNLVLGDFGLAKRFRASLTSGRPYEEPSDFYFEVDDNSPSGSFFKLADDEASCRTNERCGTPAWMSPQQHAGVAYSYEADLWALGIIFGTMSTGRMPLGSQARSLAELQVALICDSVDVRPEDRMDSDALDLLTRLLRRQSIVPMTIGEVQQHPYFVNVNWDAMARHEAPAPWVPEPAYISEHPLKTLPRPVLASQIRVEDSVHSFEFISPTFYEIKKIGVKAFFGRVFSSFKKPAPTGRVAVVARPPAALALPRPSPPGSATLVGEQKRTLRVDEKAARPRVLNLPRKARLNALPVNTNPANPKAEIISLGATPTISRGLLKPAAATASASTCVNKTIKNSVSEGERWRFHSFQFPRTGNSRAAAQPPFSSNRLDPSLKQNSAAQFAGMLQSFSMASSRTAVTLKTPPLPPVATDPVPCARKTTSISSLAQCLVAFLQPGHNPPSPSSKLASPSPLARLCGKDADPFNAFVREKERRIQNLEGSHCGFWRQVGKWCGGFCAQARVVGW